MRLIDADEYLSKEKPRGISEDAWKESHIYKSIADAPTVEAVPMSVIEDIKAEIEQKQYEVMADNDYDEDISFGINVGLILAYQIVDKHTSRKEQE